jgi:oxygen-independent coproporphyrinogen III oxidase
MSFSLYIHIPFCRSKCPYCSFASITGSNSRFVDEYIDALLSESEIRSNGIYSGTPRTIYIGGGTPSIIPIEHIRRISERYTQHKSDNMIEFTVEANPESVTQSWLDGMLDIGVNRLSLGIQAADDGILQNLGRIHSTEDAVRTFERARTTGFENISVDLMFGVPGQTMEIWQCTVHEILGLDPEHISCYSLGIEEDTEYYRNSESGTLRIPSDDETAEMYLYMAEALEKSGYARYEISNFAKNGRECLHNKAYWDFTPYLGLGASAHSFDGTMRSWNESDPEKYVRKTMRGENAVPGTEMSDGNIRAVETIMLSLRTSDGLDIKTIRMLSPENTSILKRKIDVFIKSGHMETADSGNVVFTTNGAVMANEVISDILADMI